MSNKRRSLVWTVHIAAPVLMAAVLAGCASTFDALPEAAGGLPESAPKRPAEPAAFPNVYAPFTPRETRMLDGNEQKSLEKELQTMRDTQIQRAQGPPPGPAVKARIGGPPPKKQAAKKATETKPGEKKAAAKPN